MNGATVFQMISGLGDSFSKSYDAAKKDGLAADLGEKIRTGDFAGAADVALKGGDLKTGLELVKLGETRGAGKRLGETLGGLFGGGGGEAAPATSGDFGSNLGRSYRQGELSSPARAEGSLPSFAGGGNGPVTLPGGDGNIQTRFVDALKAGGLTNPNGLAAMAAYASRESGYKPGNIMGSWSDPSESGQPGTSGGILSWRGDRFANMRRLTAGAKDPVAAQATFALTESPELTLALQNAKSPEEANQLMANAWRFAGYNRPDGEFAARLGTTRQYLTRLGGTPTTAPAATQVASAEPDAADLPAQGTVNAGFQIPEGQPQAAAPSSSAPAASALPPSLQTAGALAQARLPTGVAGPVLRAAPGSPQRVQALIRASLIPGLSEQQLSTVRTLLSSEIEQSKLTGDQRDYALAQSQGFGGTFIDFKNALSGQSKLMNVPAGTTVIDPVTRQPVFTAPDKDKTVENERKGREEAQGIRREIQGLASFKNYEQALPIYQAMVEAAPRNSKAADLNLVYGLGKIMDPGSVVREGEMVMVKNTGSLPDWLVGSINSLNGGQALTPETRTAIMTEAFGRMQAYEGALGQETSRYRDIVTRGGINPDDVLPRFSPVKPYEPPRKAESEAGAKPDAGPKSPPKRVEGGRPPDGYTWETYLSKAQGIVKERPDLRPQVEDMLAKAGIAPERLGR
ncbi:hypothetical protein [Methylobacterium sp. R2-1]|uniref:hypothetical protein n=1 Tax=Methylobacterium sp. R2-1 TaxID=2587064 RepID=UPI00162063CF|nr:hypothetical protein [Methylobacterium sp. R2-1]MBB2959839.1 hypothetical protein [Methylobacterium sp. R2-1]